MSTHHPFDLRAAERQAMAEHGFEPDFPAEVERELVHLVAHPPKASAAARDLRHLLWSSIDNDTSRDLDQIEYVERLSNDDIRVMIGIADVDLYVLRGSAIDRHAALETATVYSGVSVYPMLPAELSTGLTSLLEGDDRASVVTEFVLDSQDRVVTSQIYSALVRNKAQLAYNSVGEWLEGNAEAPGKIAASGTSSATALAKPSGAAPAHKAFRARRADPRNDRDACRSRKWGGRHCVRTAEHGHGSD